MSFSFQGKTLLREIVSNGQLLPNDAELPLSAIFVTKLGLQKEVLINRSTTVGFSSSQSQQRQLRQASM